jgi:hypothetical protein
VQHNDWNKRSSIIWSHSLRKKVELKKRSRRKGERKSIGVNKTARSIVEASTSTFKMKSMSASLSSSQWMVGRKFFSPPARVVCAKWWKWNGREMIICYYILLTTHNRPIVCMASNRYQLHAIPANTSRL